MIDVTRKELPEGWQWTTMDDIAEVIGGGTPKSKEKKYFEGGEIPWLTPADLSGYTAKHISKGARNITEAGLNSSSAKLMPAGTVLFTSRAPIGYVAIATNEISTNQGFKSFVLKSEDILPDYVYWWLKGNKQLAERMASGTTFLELSGSKAKQLPIPIAPPEQQKRIVAKIEELFSHIDAGIEALKKAKQLLKQYRQSVLKAAVTGELTKDLPCRQAGWRDTSFRNISGKRVPEKSPASPAGRDKYFAYVLECEDGSLYKGFTQDLFARINVHLEGRGAKWTKEHQPVSLIHFEEFSSEKEAVEREKYYKSGSGREWLNDLKNQQNKKYEPAAQLLERILETRRQLWEEQQLEQFKAKGKIPKDDKWKERYKLEEPNPHMILDVPVEWARSTLESITDPVRVICYGILMPKENIKEGVLYVKVKDIKGGKVLLHQLNRTKPEIAKKYERASLIEGDLLLTIRGTYGRTAIAPVELDGGNITQDTVRISAMSPISNEYIQLFIDSNVAQHYFKLIARGVAVKGVNVQDVRNMNVSIPSRKEQDVIVRMVDEKITSIDHLEEELEVQLIKAERNKQSILAKAFSGRFQ